jgi:hypothetical protein
MRSVLVQNEKPALLEKAYFVQSQGPRADQLVQVRALSLQIKVQGKLALSRRFQAHGPRRYQMVGVQVLFVQGKAAQQFEPSRAGLPFVPGEHQVVRM